MTELGENIRFLQALFEGSTPDVAECEALATLLGSREEYVAHLLLRAPKLRTNAVVRGALEKMRLAAPSIGAVGADQDPEIDRRRIEASAALAQVVMKGAMPDAASEALAVALRRFAESVPAGAAKIGDRYS